MSGAVSGNCHSPYVFPSEDLNFDVKPGAVAERDAIVAFKSTYKFGESVSFYLGTNLD